MALNYRLYVILPLNVCRWVRPVCELDDATVKDGTGCSTAAWTNTYEDETCELLKGLNECMDKEAFNHTIKPICSIILFLD